MRNVKRGLTGGALAAAVLTTGGAVVTVSDTASAVDAENVTVDNYEITASDTGLPVIERRYQRVDVDIDLSIDGRVEAGDTMDLRQYQNVTSTVTGENGQRMRFHNIATNAPVEIDGERVGTWNNRVITFNENIEDYVDPSISLSLNAQNFPYNLTEDISSNITAPFHLNIDGQRAASTDLQYTNNIPTMYNIRTMTAFSGALDRNIFESTGEIRANYGISSMHPPLREEGTQFTIEVTIPDGVEMSDDAIRPTNMVGHTDEVREETRLRILATLGDSPVEIEKTGERQIEGGWTTHSYLATVTDSITDPNVYFTMAGPSFTVDRSAIGEIDNTHMHFAGERAIEYEATVVGEDTPFHFTQSERFNISSAVVGADGQLLTPPSIYGVAPILISDQGQQLNLRHGVTAYDQEDGDISPDIDIIGEEDIDYSTPGEYPITFTVTDSDGMSTSVDSVVIVGENPWNAIAEQLQDQIDGLNDAVSALEEENAALQDQINELMERDQELQDQIDELRDRDGDLQDQINDLMEQNDEIRGVIGDMQDQIDDNLERIADLEDRIGELEGRADDLNDRVDELEGDLAEAREEIDALVDEINDLREEIDNMVREININIAIIQFFIDMGTEDGAEVEDEDDVTDEDDVVEDDDDVAEEDDDVTPPADEDDDATDEDDDAAEDEEVTEEDEVTPPAEDDEDDAVVEEEDDDVDSDDADADAAEDDDDAVSDDDDAAADDDAVADDAGADTGTDGAGEAAAGADAGADAGSGEKAPAVKIATGNTGENAETEKSGFWAGLLKFFR